MNLENLNNPSLEEKEKIKKELYRKVLQIFCNSTLNSENLGKYKNSELPTTEIIKRLQGLGLLEDVKNFQKRFHFQPKTDQEKGEEFERLARITLMLVEDNSKKKS